MVLLIQNLSYRKWRWNWRRSRNGEHRRRFGGANSVLQQHPYSRSFSAPAFLRASFPIRSLLLWPPWTTTTTNSLSRSVSSSSFWTQFSREKNTSTNGECFFSSWENISNSWRVWPTQTGCNVCGCGDFIWYKAKMEKFNYYSRTVIISITLYIT